MVLKCQVGPSILSADLSQIYPECKRLVDAGSDYLHLDVMDGNFCPYFTFGHPVVKCLKPKLPDTFFDMHMMVANPEQWVQPMADTGADQYTFHLEATSSPGELCRKVREAGMKCGMGVKPGTPVEGLMEFVEAGLVDMVLILTVEPGYGGQSFNASMMEKVKTMRSKFPTLNIEVDGQVTPDTVDLCAAAGANMVVAGASAVKAKDPAAVLKQLRDAVIKYHPSSTA